MDTVSPRIVKIGVGVPTKGSTDNQAYDNHLEFLHHLGKLQVASALGLHEVAGSTFAYPEGVAFQFYISTIARVFPALARERMAEHFIDAGCDYVLMFDDDMLLPPDTFERLYAHQKPIVAALAFTRLFPYNPVIYTLYTGWDGNSQKEYYVNKIVKSYPKNQLVSCDAVGFGTVLIDLKVCKAMKQPWFMTTSGAGEDIHFTHSAGKAGFGVYVDTALEVAHLGDRKVVTEETYEQEGGGKEHRQTVENDLPSHHATREG